MHPNKAWNPPYTPEYGRYRNHFYVFPQSYSPAWRNYEERIAGMLSPASCADAADEAFGRPFAHVVEDEETPLWHTNHSRYRALPGLYKPQTYNATGLLVDGPPDFLTLDHRVP